MCGILGGYFIEKDSDTIEFTKKLMTELKIRGCHSFGIAFHDKNSIKVMKSFELNPDNFIKAFNQSDSDYFIFHNRYSTSGNWEDMNNNQPIVINNVGAIAMNGVLSMKLKEEFEENFSVKCENHNDAEVFLRKIELGINVVDFLKSQPNCSFAGVFITNNTIWGLRNNKRPLYEFNYKNKAKFLLSTIDTINRAGGDWKEAKIVKQFDQVFLS